MVGADGAIEVHVAERNDDLQQKRCKREICATPSMAVNPSHGGMLMLQCYVWQED